jgi:hypothetical protein
MLSWLKARINERDSADEAWADGVISWIAHMRSIDAPPRDRPLPYPARSRRVKQFTSA